MRGQFHFGLGKKIIVSLIIIFVLAYIGLSVYLKIIAKNLIHSAIQNIETLYPQVQSIHYQSSRFTLYDLLTENLTVNDITVQFKESGTFWHIDQIKIHHFMAFKKDPFGSFDLEFNHLAIHSAQNGYTVFPKINHIADPSNLPLLNGDSNYNAKTHQMTLAITEPENSTSAVNLKMTLNSLSLSQAVLSNPANFLNAFTYQLSFDKTFTMSDITDLSPRAGSFLQNLGYSALPVHVDFTGNNQGSQNQENFHVDIKISELGAFKLNWTLLYSAPLSFTDFANLLNGTFPASSASLLIQSANTTYIDASFVNRIFNYLANITQQPVTTIQTEIQGILLSYATQTNIPEFTALANAIAGFVANPGSITFNFNPAIPFGFNVVGNFFSAQQQLNNFLSNTDMNNLTDAQKAVLFDRYKTVTAQAYSAFFNKIGLSVIANSGS